jgi:hypothetical protein
MLNNRMQCMPGDEVWLVGERRLRISLIVSNDFTRW